jgi:hypothetical protein
MTGEDLYQLIVQNGVAALAARELLTWLVASDASCTLCERPITRFEDHDVTLPCGRLLMSLEATAERLRGGVEHGTAGA